MKPHLPKLKGYSHTWQTTLMVMSVVMVSVLPSTLMVSSTFSGVKPNWVRINAGVLFSFTTRRSDQAASSAMQQNNQAQSAPGVRPGPFDFPARL